MRTNRLVAGLVFLGAIASPAVADTKVAGSYEVKFEEMSTNCDPVRFTYTRGVVKIDVAKSSLRVNIDSIRREMAGVPAKSGKINAKTIKKTATTIDGLDGKYNVSGRVDDNGVLQLVLVAEFTKTGETKVMCTQSWNVSGVRQTGEKAPPDTKQKKAASTFDGFLPSLDR